MARIITHLKKQKHHKPVKQPQANYTDENDGSDESFISINQEHTFNIPGMDDIYITFIVESGTSETTLKVDMNGKL